MTIIVTKTKKRHEKPSHLSGWCNAPPRTRAPAPVPEPVPEPEPEPAPAPASAAWANGRLRRIRGT